MHPVHEELSLSALAVRLGRAKSGLHKLAGKGQIPRLASGKYDPEAVAAALKSNLDPARRAPVHRSPEQVNSGERVNGGERPPDVTTVAEARDAVALIARTLREEGHAAVDEVDYNAARTAETILKARMRQLQIEEQSGRLIDADRAERGWADAMVKVRARLLAVPSDVAQLLPHLTKHDLAMVDRAVRDAMTDASENKEA